MNTTKSVWVILYTYRDYDGVIDQLLQDENNRSDYDNNVYMGFPSKELAEQYRKENYPEDHWPDKWNVREVRIND